MSKPSAPVLAWLRARLKEKNLTIASLAQKTGSKRRAIRKVMEGREPLTVDQLMTWTEALQLSLEELVAMPVPDESETPAIRPTNEDDTRFVVDPFGMQAEQALRFGFAAGIDLSFIVQSEQLENSGVPQDVLARFQEHLVIQLDAAFHSYNNPRYDDSGITLTLSFDTLYECTFPWSSLVEVRFRLDALDPEPKPEEEPPPPGLRLVK